VRIAGKLLRINHSLDREFTKIAICKFKGFGSIIQSTPMISALKKRYPDCEIIFVSIHQSREILQQIKTIDTIFTIDDKKFFRLIISCFKTLVLLIRKAPQVYIDLEIYSNFSTVFTALTLSKNRIGFHLRSSSFRMGIYTHMMFFNYKAPISEVYLQIARLFGDISEKSSLYPFHLNKNLPTAKFNEKYIVINPNASDLRIERRWEKFKFIALIKKIAQENEDFFIYLIGNQKELAYTQSIKNELSTFDKVINKAGETNIIELITLIKNSSFVITNDSGPMHIAFACATPTICLFGPCSPEQYGFIKNSIIIYKRAYCSPCIHDFEIAPCKGNNACMQLIDVDEVMDAIRQIMLSRENSFVEENNIIYKSKNHILGLVNRP
jgi:ADP-heptose:LPS heptosyltransferase